MSTSKQGRQRRTGTNSNKQTSDNTPSPPASPSSRSPPPSSSPSSSSSSSSSSSGDASKDQQPQLLVESPDKWAKWWIRTYSTLAMIFGFLILVWFGHLALVLLVMGLQIGGIKEIVDIRINKLKQEKKDVQSLVWLFKLQDVYFYLCTIFFIFGRLFISRFESFFMTYQWTALIVQHHTLLSFLSYTFGVVCFVLFLKKGFYKIQFVQLAWTIVTLLFIVIQSSFHVANIFTGLIWFFMPCGLVICNDIMAYIWGFFTGKTPLIQLSPKKTWEGFIGALFSTMIMGFAIAYLAVQFQWMICPMTSLLDDPVPCVPDPMFRLRTYHFPPTLTVALQSIGVTWNSILLYPFQLHTLILSVFASLIAPFGGFLASGFKRAFKIKDFGDTIPGHGGISDRMDCQVIMAAFAYVYHATFIQSAPTPESMLNVISRLSPSAQVELYEKLGALLTSQNLIQRG